MNIELSASRPAIRRLAQAGFPTPENIAATLAVFDRTCDNESLFAEAGEVLRDALIAGDIETAERAADHFAVLQLHERSHIHSELAVIVAPVIADAWPTADAWTFAQKRFNEAAQRLSAALKVCNPDAPAASVMAGSKGQRDAWLEYPAIVAALEDAAQVMAAAASLTSDLFKPNQAEHMVALLTDARGSNLTVQAKAWSDNRANYGRAGRWGHLIREGVKLQAADLEGYLPPVKPAQAPRPAAVHHS